MERRRPAGGRRGASPRWYAGADGPRNGRARAAARWGRSGPAWAGALHVAAGGRCARRHRPSRIRTTRVASTRVVVRRASG
jgi:hypothetical protein